MKKKRIAGQIGAKAKLAKPPTVRAQMEAEAKRREKYFRTALHEFNGEPFLAEWEKGSRSSLNEIMKFLARSYGVVEGFELANRALRQNLKMERANVDVASVVEFSRRAAKIGFFDFVLTRNGLSVDARRMALAMFIAKEFGYEANTAEQLLRQQIDRIGKIKPEGPYPVVRNIKKPVKRDMVAERRTKRAEYAERRKADKP